jgi:hypothetical protein
MKKDTLLALQKSIRHWERLLLGVDKKMGPGSCALCQKFYKGISFNPCRGCPVREAVGFGGCASTPYAAAAAPFRHGYSAGREAILPIWDELQFLRGLLPEKVKK